MTSELKPLRSEIEDMTTDLLEACGVGFDQTTELQRQLLAAFGFGMVFAIGQIRKLTPPEVHALFILLLQDVFGYAPHQAVAFAAHLIECSGPKPENPTIRQVIHRGVDGHRQWSSRDMHGLQENIRGVFAAVGA